MIRAIFIGAAAVLALAPSAFGQSAGAPGAASTAPPTAPPAPAGPATGVTPGVVGATPAGVAGGVQPYRPAGIPGSNASVGGVAGPRDSSVTGEINATLQAGKAVSGDSATVGAASATPGLRTPNPTTGTYGGLPNPTYVPPGATPYTGPPGAAPGR